MFRGPLAGEFGRLKVALGFPDAAGQIALLPLRRPGPGPLGVQSAQCAALIPDGVVDEAPRRVDDYRVGGNILERMFRQAVEPESGTVVKRREMAP